MSNKPIIAIGGENLIDRVQTSTSDGAPVFANNPGGSPFNVAVAIALQAGNAHYLTPISTDPMGDLLAKRLTDAGVQIAAPRRPEPTTLAIVTLQDGIPSYEFQRHGTAERCVTEGSIMEALPRGAVALHIGSLALVGGADAAIWEAVFHAAKQDGLFVTLDPNVRPSLIENASAYRARLKRLFQSADLIKLSDEDLNWIYPDMSLPDALQTLREAACAALVVLTKGAEGAEGLTKRHHVKIDAATVQGLQDTIGAGDTFMGTLLATLSSSEALNDRVLEGIRSDTLESLLDRAACAAALNCAKEGCNPPTRLDIDSVLMQRDGA